MIVLYFGDSGLHVNAGVNGDDPYLWGSKIRSSTSVRPENVFMV